jgi:peptidoglycan/xylan/chitin deacetylase (PgdA/CDA1 family)
MQYIFLSHDVDWRRQGPSIEHILSRKDRFDVELFEKTKPEDLYRNIPEYMELEEKFGVRSTFFFRTFYENGDVLDYEDDIKQLQKSNWEIGLHTDPSSIDNLDKIRLEKEKLESITGKQIFGNRVHFLNYNPELPNKLEKLGFNYDSSLRHSKDRIDEKEMGYSRIHGIIEFPVTLMDAYLFTYMKIREEKIISEFQKTLDLGRSLSENNVISVIWHENVLKMKGGRVYKQILEFLTSQDDVEIKRGIDLVKILK